MSSEFENPYLQALHELLRQHSRSLQQPLKDLSNRLEALELGAARESEAQEEKVLYVETSRKEQYWLNYAQIATVAVLPRNTSGGWIQESALSQRAERKIIICLTQPWNTVIVMSLHRKGSTQIDKPEQKRTVGDSVAFSANKLARSIADKINLREIDSLTTKYEMNNVESNTLEIRIEAIRLR